jgi:hypothetical protein
LARYLRRFIKTTSSRKKTSEIGTPSQKLRAKTSGTEIYQRTCGRLGSLVHT